MKLEEGDYGLDHMFAITDINEETVSEAPYSSPQFMSSISTKRPVSLTPVMEEVISAVRSMECASAGGSDGLQSQHLKDLISESAQRSVRNWYTGRLSGVCAQKLLV